MSLFPKLNKDLNKIIFDMCYPYDNIDALIKGRSVCSSWRLYISKQILETSSASDINTLASICLFERKREMLGAPSIQYTYRLRFINHRIARCDNLDRLAVLEQQHIAYTAKKRKADEKRRALTAFIDELHVSNKKPRLA